MCQTGENNSETQRPTATSPRDRDLVLTYKEGGWAGLAGYDTHPLKSDAPSTRVTLVLTVQ